SIWRVNKYPLPTSSLLLLLFFFFFFHLPQRPFWPAVFFISHYLFKTFYQHLSFVLFLSLYSFSSLLLLSPFSSWFPMALTLLSSIPIPFSISSISSAVLSPSLPPSLLRSCAFPVHSPPSYPIQSAFPRYPPSTASSSSPT